MTNDEIIRALTTLVSKRGVETFGASPIVRPSSDFLPDAWEPTLDATSRLLRRLMLYAGLDLDATLQTFDRSRGVYHQSTIAWFAGIEDRRALFGIDIGQLTDPQSLIASLCHEVAHAYRAQHNLVVDDQEQEEQLTDLTSIFLGFGIFAVNASERWVKKTYLQGNSAVTEFGGVTSGYITAEEASFAFAVQLAARGSSRRAVKAICHVLEPNQAQMVRSALAAFDGDAIRTQLGISVIPPPIPLERFTRPYSNERSIVVEERHKRDGSEPRRHEGRPVFRVRESWGRWLVLVYFGILIALIPAIAVGTDTGNRWAPAAILAAGITVSLWRGGFRRRDRCSGPKCDLVLPADALICEHCGGRVSGRINSSRDHLEAEERFEESGLTI